MTPNGGICHTYVQVSAPALHGFHVMEESGGCSQSVRGMVFFNANADNVGKYSLMIIRYKSADGGYSTYIDL